jgi:hypothetical protein
MGIATSSFSVLYPVTNLALPNRFAYQTLGGLTAAMFNGLGAKGQESTRRISYGTRHPEHH